MGITQTQEGQLSARLSAKFAQDKKVPLLINIKDGRLLPNSLNIRANVDYRPYTGNPRASKEERMAFVASSLGTTRTRVINSMPDIDLPTFDIGRATKAELVAFAMDEFALVLSEETDIRTLRKQLMMASERAQNPVDPDLG